MVLSDGPDVLSHLSQFQNLSESRIQHLSKVCDPNPMHLHTCGGKRVVFSDVKLCRYKVSGNSLPSCWVSRAEHEEEHSQSSPPCSVEAMNVNSHFSGPCLFSHWFSSFTYGLYHYHGAYKEIIKRSNYLSHWTIGNQ